jgi:hypothetical protein
MLYLVHFPLLFAETRLRSDWLPLASGWIALAPADSRLADADIALAGSDLRLLGTRTRLLGDTLRFEIFRVRLAPFDDGIPYKYPSVYRKSIEFAP